MSSEPASLRRHLSRTSLPRRWPPFAAFAYLTLLETGGSAAPSRSERTAGSAGITGDSGSPAGAASTLAALGPRQEEGRARRSRATRLVQLRGRSRPSRHVRPRVNESTERGQATRARRSRPQGQPGPAARSHDVGLRSARFEGRGPPRTTRSRLGHDPGRREDPTGRLRLLRRPLVRGNPQCCNGPKGLRPPQADTGDRSHWGDPRTSSPGSRSHAATSTSFTRDEAKASSSSS